MTKEKRLVMSSEARKWPEFIAFAARLGIVNLDLIDNLTISVDMDDRVRISRDDFAVDTSQCHNKEGQSL